METKVLHVKVPEDQLEFLEDIVEENQYVSKSEMIREMIRKFINEYVSQEYKRFENEKKDFISWKEYKGN